MIIPSIDIMRGQAVQLIGGEVHALDAGDPVPIAKRFRLAGEVAVIDLDAALGKGSNAEQIAALIDVAPCRVGGGIRSYEAAVRWLDRGSHKVILGTAAVPELLQRLPRKRLIAALDSRDGEVVVNGWRTATGESILERMARLRPYVDGFLVTFVEKEGRMGGTRLELVPEIVKAAGDARVTIAGGITTAEEVAALDALGADAQVGMAIYTGRLQLGDAITAPLRSDRHDGLWPTVVTNESGVALGLCYSSALSVREAVATGRGVYHSRTRGLWRKGESSGSTQEVLRIDADCDRDALRFTVRQSGTGFCHLGTPTCWGGANGLPALEARIAKSARDAAPGSYTSRLLASQELLNAKLIEEAGELAHAKSKADVVHEAADVLFFALVAAARGGASLVDLERELDRRALCVTRRPGDAKPVAKGAT